MTKNLTNKETKTRLIGIIHNFKTYQEAYSKSVLVKTIVEQNLLPLEYVKKCFSNNPPVNIYFDSKKDAQNYLSSIQLKYDNFYEAKIKEGKKAQSIACLIRKGIFTSQEVHGKFLKAHWLCKYFESKKDVFNYLKANAPKYFSFREARHSDLAMASIQSLCVDKKINIDEVYSYFGGIKSSVGSKKLCRHFNTIQDFELYLKKNAHKYESFTHAARMDEKLSLISNLLTHKKIKKSLIEKYIPIKQVSRRELKAIIKLEKEIKLLPGVTQTKREFSLTDGGRLDLKVTLSNKRVIFVEGKHDESQWNKFKTSTQISRYKRQGKKMFGNNYATTILCSPKGKYGITFEEAKKIILSYT